MKLTSKETNLIFSIMQDLSGEFGHSEIRQRVGEKLLELLNADFFASFVWDEDEQRFISGVNINMSEDNLLRYDQYYQFHDPITPTLQRRTKATAVSRIMEHERLSRTQFFNDFLRKDGLHFGLNYFAYDRGDNIGDLRIWRKKGKEDFSARDEQIIDAIGPSFVNALLRAKFRGEERIVRFVNVRDQIDLTEREAQIADLMVIGLSDDDICTRLCIAKPTLRSHIASIFRKTNVQRRTQLAHYLNQISS